MLYCCFVLLYNYFRAAYYHHRCPLLTEWWEVTLLLLHAIHFTSVQLTTTDPAATSLIGYMVAPREDTGTPLDGSVAYVGSWENRTDMKLLCNGVSTFEC